MLGWRLAVSAIVVPLLLGLFYWDSQLGDGAPVLLVFCLLLTIRGAFELVYLLKTRVMRPVFSVTAICCVLTVLAAWGQHRLLPTAAGLPRLLQSMGLVGASLVFSFLILLLTQAIRYRKPGHSMESLGANSLTVLYAGGLLAVIAQFRWYPNPQIGYFAMGSVIIAAKAGDVMAYTFGRLWGKRKMVPLLSPGKTWMGGFGAVVGSCLGGWLWLTFGGRLFDARPVVSDMTSVLCYSAVIGVVGLIGDLCESLIKRDVEKKDSATLMPGFGGLLDMLDSPLFAGPIALAWWVLWPPVG
ncbi:MAG: phosphatidate cytidylyltransferase [Planctomycetaceae bacterium]|nr:phosphatidate cytidylyltransferase [Planctomycetaceae bacterium]